MDEIIEQFIKERSKEIPSNLLRTPIYSVAPQENGHWIPENNEKKTDNPGYLFYTHPAKTVKREGKSLFSIKQSNKINNSIFSFEYPVDDKLLNLPLKSKIESTPPLESISFKPAVNEDPRIDVSNIYDNYLFYRRVDFKDITSQFEIVEPVVINFFLYDIESHQRVSEVWRFLPEKMKSFPMVNALMSKAVLDAPKSVSFPFPVNDQNNDLVKGHKCIALICSLDRELFRDGGASIKKYLEKPNDASKKKAAIDDVKECTQHGTTQTFAWCAKSLNEALTHGEEQILTFDSFVSVPSTLSDGFLKEQFANKAMPKFKEKHIPYSVSIIVHHKTSDEISNRLRHFYNFQHSLPYQTFENTLYINLLKARFKFPPKMRGRNIIVNVSLMDNGKELPVFNGEHKYVSRTQYHEEKPDFYDVIKIDLPIDLSHDSYLYFTFQHASVKKNASKNVEELGSAKYNLFYDKNSNAIIPNKVHSAPISYPNQPLDESEDNRITFETNLFSSFYSSDPQIAAILNGQVKAQAPELTELHHHLFAVLDQLINGIQEERDGSFETLLQVLSLYKNNNRNDPLNIPLIYYIKYCAFRFNHNSFYIHLAHLWLQYVKSHEELVRPDLQVSWFLFELITKSLVLDTNVKDLKDLEELTKTLSGMIPKYRDVQTLIGEKLNNALCLFFKDIIEVSTRSIGFQMIITHLNYLDPTQHRFDRLCFRDLLTSIFSPKIFLFSLLQTNQSNRKSVTKQQKQQDLNHMPTFFEQYIIPKIEAPLSVEQHTNSVFEIIFNILRHFDTKMNQVIYPKLIPLLRILSSNIDILKGFSSRSNLIFIFYFVHYIFYYMALDQNIIIKKNFFEMLSFQLEYAKHLTDDEVKAIIDAHKMSGFSLDNINKFFAGGISKMEKEGEGKETRKFASKKMSHASISSQKNQAQSQEYTTITKIFDTLAFLTQSIAIYTITLAKSIYSLNYIIATMFDKQISPYLEKDFMETSQEFIVKNIKDNYTNKESNIKHIISKIIQYPTERKINLLNEITKAERKELRKDVRTKILVARALYKHSPTEETVELMAATEYKDLCKKIYDLDAQLTPQLKAENPSVYSYLLLEKEELLIMSPDSRVDILLKLYEHQNATGFISEAVMAQICAAALISEYLCLFQPDLWKKDIFQCNHPAEKFTVACPAAISMIVPQDQEKDRIVLRGYCTTKYFTEYGMIYLVQAAMETCKKGTLFELSTRIHSILNPILLHRHLWYVLQKHYITGQLSWKISGQMYTASDRMLGLYYKVEYPDKGVFIYREFEQLNLWQVSARLQKSSQIYAGGKEVQVVTEGLELDKNKFNDPNKYYVHVKFLTQYFTPEEKTKRITVFEQNHNISQFYFDIPYSKDAQSGLEHCSLKRTIFTLPHPLPYLVNRVFIPPKNIETIIFSPIEYAVQNLQSQVGKIQEACVRVRAELDAAQRDMLAGKPQGEIQSMKELQPLIQGSLLVQVNEGPEKMAEVFLTGEENPHQGELRSTFRDFIEANTLAVKLHGELVMRYPMYSVLQEELELGLSKLTSKLQQFLK